MCYTKIMSFWGFGRTQSKKEMISTLRAEKEVLQHSDEENRKKISNLEDETKELRQSIQRLESENEELSKKLHTEEPYEKIYNERQDLIQDASKKDSKIQKLKDERRKLKDTIVELNSESDSFRADVETERRKLEENSKEKADLITKLEETCKEKDDLVAQVEEFEKEKCEYEDEIAQLKQEFDKIKQEKAEFDKTREEKLTSDKAVNTEVNAHIEESRQELAEYKSRAEDLQLASEALKSENESLFRANESKAKEINDIKKDLTGIKQELTREQLKFTKLQQDWEEDRRGTEFVLVSKSARRKSRNRYSSLESTKEENDSEDEHILSLVESAKAESEALREKERAYKKRISELQTDKTELFRSGSSLFMENKSLKARYDSVLGERDKLLKLESSLKRKVREQDKEISDLKKTVDDMYYQNISIKANEENEHKRNAYVVVMGNEMVKTLEREKSALYRRVKFLEKENNEIESRVMELQKQSDTLIKYTHKFDRQLSGRRESRTDVDRNRNSDRNDYDFDQTPSQKALPYHDFQEGSKFPPPRIFSQDMEEMSSNGRRQPRDIFEESKPTQYRNYSRDRISALSQKSNPYSDRNQDSQLRPQRTTSRDPFSDERSSPSRSTFRDPFSQAFDPFRPRVPRHAPTHETGSTIVPKSQDSHISLPRIDDAQSPRPRSHSSKGRNSKRGTPIVGRQ